MIGALIGKGNTADIFEMGNDKVIKLFHPGYAFNGELRDEQTEEKNAILDYPAVRLCRK